MTTVRQGQFAVVRTSGLAARLIRWATDSPVNHALVCVTDGREPVCVEARPHGAGRVNASAYPDAIWSDWPLSPSQAARIATWAMSAVGTPYGWLDCLAAGLDSFHERHAWFPAFRWVARRLASLRTMMCSQLVAEAYASVGVKLGPPDALPCELTPGDLLDSIRSESVAPSK